MDNELEFAKNLAREAGKIMLRYFRADDIGTTWKKDATPITLADTQINDLIIERIQAEYPEHGVHGEERSVNEGREWMWICDPVDGTMPFSIGLPISTFSLGLARNGVPQLGVVYDPFSDRMFTGVTSGDAMMNGAPIKVNSNVLENGYVASETWSPHGSDDPGLLPLFGLRERLLDAGVKPLSPSSFIIAACLVASGEMVGAIFGCTKPEDLAAVKVVVEAAGGKVTDIDGNDQRYDQSINGAIVSNGLVHDELIRLVKESLE